MMNTHIIQLISSLKNEFAAVRYSADHDNDRNSWFLKRLREAGSMLQGEEKIIFDVFESVFVLDFFYASFSGDEFTNVDLQDISRIETWTTLEIKNHTAGNFRKNDLQLEALKKISTEKYRGLFNIRGVEMDYYKTLHDWYLLKKINFLSDSFLFTKDELKENNKEIAAHYDTLINGNEGNVSLYFMHTKIQYPDPDDSRDKPQKLKMILESEVEGDYRLVIISDLMGIYRNTGRYAEALALAEQAGKQFPDSPFLKEIRYQEDTSTAPMLRLAFEKQVQSSRPVHLVAEYRNIPDFVLSIYEVKANFASFLEYVDNYYAQETHYEKVEKQLVRQEYYQLPAIERFETAKTSLEIRPLPPGLYVAEFSLKNPVDNDGRTQYFFTVSDYKVIFYRKDENDFPVAFRLVNSEDGKPVPHEKLVFFEYVRDRDLAKLHAGTDENGIFEIPSGSGDVFYRNYLIRQPATNDFQIMDIYGRKLAEDQEEKSIRKTVPQIFTDRAIYRPGQTVYFKVINSEINGKKESVVAGLKQKIALTDGNEQEISSQEFTTGEFGAYHGSFDLPAGLLNGTFALRIECGTEGFHAFRVEEYKRPKFEITFEPLEEEYWFGQSTELKGKAISLSGIPLSRVSVHYEIKKNDIRWKFFSRYSRDYPYDNPVIGKVETDEKGRFAIPVTFVTDSDPEEIQVEQFEIEASVTDLNGETQSAGTDITVASVPYYIKAEDIKQAFTNENVTVTVETKNYNNRAVEKPYHVRLSLLKPADRIFRSSFTAEIQNLSRFSREEFIAKFPHDYFDEEERKAKERTVKVIIDRIHDPAAHNRKSGLDLGKLPPGRYRLELSDADPKKQIGASRYFNVREKASLNGEKIFLDIDQSEKEVFRGETAVVYAYSAIPDARVNVFLQDCLGNTVSEIKEFRNGVLEYRVEMPEDKNISEMDLQFQLVAYNDVQHRKVKIRIKENEDPLFIETVTFRDKIEPGTKEKWSVKVSGKANEEIAAEVLAAMYDLSLDQFAANTWEWEKLSLQHFTVLSYEAKHRLSGRIVRKRVPYVSGFYIEMPDFNWYDGDLPEGIVFMGGSASVGSAVLNEMEPTKMHKKIAMGDDKERGISTNKSNERLQKIPVRQNLNETAFFYPDLRTDSEGNVTFEFTSPEALTKWKLMFLAHTKDARAATLEKEVVTQKEFSVTPNYPRFLREGDELNLQSKLSNLTDKKLNGYAGLQILDAFTNEDISDQFRLSSLTAVAGYNKEQAFSLDAKGNSVVTWKIRVPQNVSSIILKVVAKAGKYSDGEQQAVAVLPNRMLVTDALPVFVKEGESKTFELENLKNADSKTITNVSNTLELTTNPVWEILFALPGLKNDPNSSADVVFNKWFADVVASEIFKANPKIKTVLEQYHDQGLLKSSLEKNQELKQLLLEETPWVLESKNEQEQMQKLALLFDANTMKNSITQDWADLQKLQNPDGSFSWYPGYPASYSTSVYILKSLGKINAWLKGNVKDDRSSEQTGMVKNLIGYIDDEISKYADPKDKNVWNNWTLDYLDARNYWKKEYPLKGKGATLKTLVKQKAKTAKLTDFTFFGLHRAALLMNDYGLKEVSDKLMSYLKETSVETKTQGVYWKQNLDDWGWFSSKVVNHAGALEAFNKLKPEDQNFIEEMKIWLVTQKEVNTWGSSRGTAEVIYTLLNSGKSWTGAESDKATIIWGGKELKPETEAAGYVKSTAKSDAVDRKLATVTVTKPGPGIVQGGLFWQYYEDLDQIKSSETYLSVAKELYRKIKTVNGEELQKISPETPLKVGNRVTVRMILNTDRPMEFIHIKDMRAAGFEPVDVLSGYQWKNSLGYYQSTKDASTNFYIERMQKGKYVFEYDLVANASGKFSNGITTIQNYYAPQMSSHTKGENVEIRKYNVNL